MDPLEAHHVTALLMTMDQPDLALLTKAASSDTIRFDPECKRDCIRIIIAYKSNTNFLLSMDEMDIKYLNAYLLFHLNLKPSSYKKNAIEKLLEHWETAVVPQNLAATAETQVKSTDCASCRDLASRVDALELGLSQTNKELRAERHSRAELIDNLTRALSASAKKTDASNAA